MAQPLARSDGVNCYHQFFRTFPDSNFLTFNYDSLPETFLFRLGRWYPRDGYGVPVRAHLPPGSEEFDNKTSSALVLHLHGSLCIRTSEYTQRLKPGEAIVSQTKRNAPLYTFAPYSISANFGPFPGGKGADDVEDRIIAPVPDKSHGLKHVFIRATYAKALGLLQSSGPVVAIGYSFNPHDKASYQPLLNALGDSKDRRLLVL